MARVAGMWVGVALLAVVAGCGGEAGTGKGAAVSVYVAAGLCEGAERRLAAAGGEAGTLTVRGRCLPAERDGGLDLAAVGANARRASEDSAAVAYLLSEDPAAARFATPILKAAGIGSLESTSGAAAMRRALKAIAAADPTSSIRDEVRKSLESARSSY